jgi:hypothetical protein
MARQEIIDAHSHVYPDGCLTEVIKNRPDFGGWVSAGVRGQCWGQA